MKRSSGRSALAGGVAYDGHPDGVFERDNWDDEAPAELYGGVRRA